jgi:hypothetical protein
MKRGAGQRMAVPTRLAVKESPALRTELPSFVASLGFFWSGLFWAQLAHGAESSTVLARGGARASAVVVPTEEKASLMVRDAQVVVEP